MKPVIGIDLGTTNCALAYTAGETVEQFAIPQLVQPGETGEESLLPSFVFLDPAGPIVGVLAQKKGLENAGRLVASAKSWLSHSGVDREAAILPPNAPEGVDKISPVEASQRCIPAQPHQSFRVADFDRLIMLSGGGKTVWVTQLEGMCGYSHDDQLIGDAWDSQYCSG